MRIILDAMGGDHAPEAMVQGALDAVAEFGVELTLVGRGPELLEIHTARERMSVESVGRVWRYVREVLRRSR